MAIEPGQRLPRQLAADADDHGEDCTEHAEPDGDQQVPVAVVVGHDVVDVEEHFARHGVDHREAERGREQRGHDRGAHRGCGRDGAFDDERGREER